MAGSDLQKLSQTVIRNFTGDKKRLQTSGFRLAIHQARDFGQASHRRIHTT